MIAQALLQSVTYWAPNGNNAYGNTIFVAPTTIKCRWEDKIELFRDKTGKEVASKSKVFFLVPVKLDGYLYLGESIEADPRNLSPNAYEIRGVFTTPDLRNLKSLTVAYL